MGVKEDGLKTGSIVFACIWVVLAIVLGQYVHWRTKERNQAGDNRRYSYFHNLNQTDLGFDFHGNGMLLESVDLYIHAPNVPPDYSSNRETRRLNC